MLQRYVECVEKLPDGERVHRRYQFKLQLSFFRQRACHVVSLSNVRALRIVTLPHQQHVVMLFTCFSQARARIEHHSFNSA